MGDKLNCWEFTECGRQPGGSKVSAKGICRAAQDHHYHGVNGGQAAGRFCWTEPESDCKIAIGGNYGNCLQCPFFREVMKDEGKEHVMTRSAFIGIHPDTRSPPINPPVNASDPCEYLDNCGFYQAYNHTSEAEEHGWIELFCRHQSSSQHCDRKIILLKTGSAPANNLTPTGIYLDVETLST